MILTDKELKDYYNGLQKTIELNLKLLQDGIVEPEALAEELEQLEQLKEKINQTLLKRKKEQKKQL
ncbi:hypothetical protein FUAX_23330 [Fulvitalea axinellae]|uniref:CARD domain-containing protein n=1 Tax=Fulvitalea axinellae TaxID=1182444 RepID=A0AAU9CLM3_9BACT|nr:hypothetical protein FUAX_23330 [Fulvitalea axinellae]